MALICMHLCLLYIAKQKIEKALKCTVHHGSLFFINVPFILLLIYPAPPTHFLFNSKLDYLFLNPSVLGPLSLHHHIWLKICFFHNCTKTLSIIPSIDIVIKAPQMSKTKENLQTHLSQRYLAWKEQLVISTSVRYSELVSMLTNVHYMIMHILPLHWFIMCIFFSLAIFWKLNY